MGIRGLESPARHSLEIRTLTGAQAQAELSALLDQSFPVPKGARFFDDFPVWDENLHPRGRLASFGFYDGLKLVATSSVRVAKLKLPEGNVPIAIIGGVATDDKHRGHGLASQGVSLAIDWAREQGAAAVFLWGSEHALYQRLGFELCGKQHQVPLAEIAQAQQNLKTDQRLGLGWTPALSEALLKRPSGLALTQDDLRWIQAHKNVRWYWMGSYEHPTAYAAIGRGIDLQGIVHEWGGKRESLLSLLTQISGREPGAMLMGSPELLEAYGIAHASEQAEFLCMAKILDPVALLKGYDSQTTLAAKQLPEGSWNVSFGSGKQLVCLSDRELVDLFYWNGASGDAQSTLPLWFWGLDGA